MSQKRRKLLFSVGIGVILLGFVLLIEGGFRISRKSLPGILEEIERGDGRKVSSVAEKDDLAIVYCPGNDEQEAIIYELSQNPITKMYSISDRNVTNKEWGEFMSVVESPFHIYCYGVDLTTGGISFFEGSLCDHPYISCVVIMWGIILVYLSKRRTK